MTGRRLALPQVPRRRVVALTGPLALPPVEPLAPLTVAARLLDVRLAGAPASTSASLERLCAIVCDPGWAAEPGHAGLSDELEPYLDEPAPERRSDEIPKLRVEFAAYSRLAGRHSAFGEMDGAAFVRLLLDVHRRLGTGQNALRDRPVGLRPDSAGNKVVFPDQRLCPALLAALHEFLRRHAAAHPALSATVAYTAVLHAHPFNDGNGRTARTLYNLVLAAGAGTRHFVPIRLIAATHRAAFLIKLRRALYGGDWSGLQAFFNDAFRLSVGLQE
jgi:hypothetical protein